MLKELKIADIKIGHRHRKDMGDLTSLADSIRQDGFLQPIGVTEKLELVFGERRLRAHRDILKKKTILARIISVPLAFLGSYYGFKQDEIKNPVRFNQIPRQIPEQAWFMQPIFSILVGGILPFGAVFIEMFFIMTMVISAQVTIKMIKTNNEKPKT